MHIIGGIDDVDVLLSALADPTRRRVVELLGAGPRRAGDLAQSLGLEANSITRHLKQLRDSGIVEAVTVREDIICVSEVRARGRKHDTPSTSHQEAARGTC